MHRRVTSGSTRPGRTSPSTIVTDDTSRNGEGKGKFRAANAWQAFPEVSIAMRILLHWILNALALVIVAHVVPGVAVHDPISALVAAVLLGLANAVIRPI